MKVAIVDGNEPKADETNHEDENPIAGKVKKVDEPQLSQTWLVLLLKTNNLFPYIIYMQPNDQEKLIAYNKLIKSELHC